MGKVIVFANTKGGVGKSCLAVHSAVALSERGFRVSLLDADAQKTSSKWLTEMKGHTVSVIATADKEKLVTQIEDLSRDAHYLLVDTKGSAGHLTSQAILLSDYTVVPFQPSGADIWPIENVLTLIRVSRFRRNGKPIAWMVLNNTSERDRAGRDVRALAAKFEVPIAQNTVRRLNAFRDASTQRTVVGRIKTKTAEGAAKRFELLLDELLASEQEQQRTANA